MDAKDSHCVTTTRWVSHAPWQDSCNMPPNKLSKIEVTKTTNALLHKAYKSYFDTEAKEEDHFLDLESVHMFQDNGSVTRNKIDTQNRNQISTHPSYSTVNRIDGIRSSNQWQLHSVDTLPSEEFNAKCSSLYEARTCGNFAGFTYSQELYSQPVCSQPVLSSVSFSSHLKNAYREFQADTQCDPSMDQGYGSHSTGSSYQGQDSEKEGSVEEQGSQMDLGMEERGRSAGNRSVDGDNSVIGENELEDLLYHFQNFFQDRFNSEFHRYQEAVYGILKEQQNHVRQIVHTALQEQYSSQKSYAEELSEDAKKTAGESKHASQTDISLTQMLDTDFYVHIPVSNPSGSLSDSSSLMKEERVRRRLLDLYSLSCSVSTMLAKTQFKS